MKGTSLRILATVATAIVLLASCSKKNDPVPVPTPRDPNTAAVVSVDRFSSAAGHLQVRTATNGLPDANVPVNFDEGPFITRGLTPDGHVVDYYNFDIQPTAPAPIWVLFKKDGTAVSGQMNIIDVIPGETGYNDFWQVIKVTVPDNYVANTITSYDELLAKGYPTEKTNNIVNCPVVPKGSTAAKRLTSEDPGLTRGWYKDKVVFYFNFSEKALTTASGGAVPVAPIYVTFNINPSDPNGGPASGFKAEPGTTPLQTHNVVAVVPTDNGYSPLWSVVVYDNNSFNSVRNLSTAVAAPVLVPSAGNVNCPVVHIQ